MTAAATALIDGDRATSESGRKRRSGSNKRQRTEQLKLSLLPAERALLEQAASDLGFTGQGKVQQLILMRLGDLITS